MQEFQQKKNIKNKLYSKAVIVVLIIIFLILAKAVFGLYYKQKETRDNLARAEKALQDIQNRKQILESENQRLQSTDGIEEEIRQKFQVSKEGEKVIVVVDDQKTANQATTSPSFFLRAKNAIINFIK